MTGGGQCRLIRLENLYVVVESSSIPPDSFLVATLVIEQADSVGDSVIKNFLGFCPFALCVLKLLVLHIKIPGKCISS